MSNGFRLSQLILAVNKAEAKLRKPVQHSQLDFLLQQLRKPATDLSKIALPMQGEIRYVALSEIVRCEADNTYTHFFLLNGERILVSKPLKEYADLLRIRPMKYRSVLAEPPTIFYNSGDRGLSGFYG